MKAMFVIAKRIGDGLSIATAWRPWFGETIRDWAGIPYESFFICNVFNEDQVVLDNIAADPRTVASFPIDVLDNALAYDEAFEVPPATQGKIIAWAAQQWGVEFRQEVAANAKSRRYVAEKIMRKASGVLGADPLQGWRIHWIS